MEAKRTSLGQRTKDLLPREFLYLIAEIKTQIEDLERKRIRNEKDEEELTSFLELKKVLEINLEKRINRR
jgi:hypothetical protein